MHFIVNSKEISRACMLASQAVDNNNYNPVVTNFKLILDTDLTILATNLQISVCVHVPVEVKKTSEICVNAKKLTEFLRTLKGPVEFKLVRNSLTITTNNAKCVLPIIKADEFPNIKIVDEDQMLPVPSLFFYNGIKKAGYCCASKSDNSKYLLSSVMIKMSNNPPTATIVSTDGRRLAVYDHQISADQVTSNVDAPISKDTVEFLIKCLKYDDCDDVYYHIGQYAISIKFGKTLITKFQIMEGIFPDFRRIIPEESSFTNKLIVSASLLHKAVKQVGLFTKNNNDGTINMQVSNNKILLTASDILLGSGETTVECETQINDDNCIFILQPEHLLQSIQAIDYQDIIIYWESPTTFLTLRGEDKSNIHIISTVEE